MVYFLYYDDVNDTLSFKTDLPQNSQVLLFESYDDNGYHKKRIQVGNSGFTFMISTNFGYGKSSYLRFRAEYKGTILYHYQDKEGKYGISSPSEFFRVEPDIENWFDLLTLLCNVYKNRDNWNINQCLKWQEARLVNTMIENPILLARTLSEYLEMLKETHIATCSPIISGTDAIIGRELPLLVQILLEENQNKVNQNYANQAVVAAFEYMKTTEKIDNFLKYTQIYK